MRKEKKMGRKRLNLSIKIKIDKNIYKEIQEIAREEKSTIENVATLFLEEYLRLRNLYLEGLKVDEDLLEIQKERRGLNPATDYVDEVEVENEIKVKE